MFLSARLWRSIHPAVFANKSGGLEPEMKIAAIAAVACFGLVWAGLVGLRTLQIKQKERLDGLAVHGELESRERTGGGTFLKKDPSSGPPPPKTFAFWVPEVTWEFSSFTGLPERSLPTSQKS